MNPYIANTNEDVKAMLETIGASSIEELFKETVRLGGTLSGEHGIGIAKRPYIPIALDECVREGRIKDGDTVLMAAFGGGLTWASAIMKW